ncbi:hypothetical protein O6H91_17G041300 [Diphasiastrum complanatum]|uniref:Uncharacterized protein n=1 Tax=Diphasiastrum complanatum TaxID=34168 RepID=A0ACC2B5Z6_DIPCM|nr:hypothetical protein O6H91_17G041300 [Diphasiastrum complanatum]
MLWKLDISKNHLTSCVCFSGMKSLTQLSIERNKIHSLKGLECLQCLMELYAAKNDILDIKELIHLRALSKLMVLDLSGNGVCECPGYRSYSIYTMRRLKVFDGRIVAHAEIHAAREVHAGRLTRDMLEQQLGHCNFHQIEVDGLVGLKLIEILILDDNNIKEFEPLCFAGLGYLRELHMKNNALHTLGPLEHLSSLEKLDLASNHLTSNRLGGLSSVEGLALLPKLSDLKLANNPMSRQPHYRVTIVRRLLQLRYLDGKEIAEVERLEAENFSGSKVWPASVPYCMDPSSMLENSSCASTTSHLLPAKVPVKLTCLNFEAMCSPSPNLSSGQTVLIRKTVLAGGQSRSKCGEFWEFK